MSSAMAWAAGSGSPGGGTASAMYSAGFTRDSGWVIASPPTVPAPARIRSLWRERDRSGSAAASQTSSRVPAEASSTVISTLVPRVSFTMSQIDRERESDDEDEPLSAEAQGVMDRARRRAAISMVLMLIGFMAIAIVVVYRLATMSEAPAGQYTLEALARPAGETGIATRLGDGLVTVTDVLAGATAIRLFDGADGALIREIAVVGQ